MGLPELRPQAVTDYIDMRGIESAHLVTWPETELLENFYFDCATTFGTFTFEFRWLDNRWRCWVTTPAGDKREIGIWPNALSGAGFLDYGFDVRTDRAEIDFSSLFDLELYILKWQG